MNLNWKHPRVFYGWWIVGACFFISVYLAGAVALGFTAFFEPIANEYGWSYTQISIAASLRGVEVGLLAPLIGLLTDRWGPRRLMFGGSVLLGLGLMFLSRTTSLGIFYGAFAVVAAGASGLSPTVMMTAVANWFWKNIGMATGIMVSGFALGGLLVPVVVRLIDAFGWRPAIFILGVGMWVIGLPLSLLVRHKPEQYGYLPDGELSHTVIPGEGPVPAQIDEVDIGTKQALRSRAFWHIGLALTFQFLSVNAVIIHIMPYLSSVGIARSTSSLVVMGTGVTNFIGRLVSGKVSDNIKRKRAAAGFHAITCLALLLFSYISDERTWLLAPFTILFGFGWGGTSPMRAVLVREYFGRANFGTILGFLMGLSALGAVGGPLFAAWIFDSQGSYQVAWLVFTGLVLAAMMVMATTPPVSAAAQSADNV